MALPAYYHYKSEAIKNSCFAYFDTLARKKWPVASEERTVPTSYGPTFVTISGPEGAPPLVLLPGAATPALMWAPNIQALSSRYRTYALDQIGDFGRSLCTRHFKSFDEMPEWLNETFDGLGLGDGINVAGISYGGALAAQYTLHSPHRLNKVILLAPGATVHRLNAGFVARPIWAAVTMGRGLPALMRWMSADVMRRDPHWLDETLEGLQMNMRSMERRRLPNPGVWTDAMWAGLQVPVLFLVGEHEVIYPAWAAVNHLKRVAPRVTAEIVREAGHDLTFAQPEWVDQRILEFLDQAPEASS